VADGLLSPDDMMVYGADGLKPTKPPERYFRHPILPIGWDWDKPPSERKKELAMPMIFAEPAKFGKGLMDYFTGTMTDGMGYYDTYPTYDYEPSPQERFENAGVNFALDFGLLPAVGGAVVSPASKNALRMGAGGGETKNVRSVDDLGFYSEALEQAKLLPMNSGTGEQFFKMLEKRGVKKDEITYTPELEGLLSQPRVTKEELVSLLEQNRIRPQETVFAAKDSQYDGMNFPDRAEILSADQAYGDEYLYERGRDIVESDPDGFVDFMAKSLSDSGGELTQIEQQKIIKAIEENRIDDLDNLESDVYIDNPNIYKIGSEIDDRAKELAVNEYDYDPVLRLSDPDTGYEIIGSDATSYMIRTPDGTTLPDDVYSINEARIIAEDHAINEGIIGYGGGEARFFRDTEEGGTNYQERFLQIPEFAGSTGEDFIYGAHFDEPNVVVHARTKNRKMAKDAKSTLYVEELQSDWGQQGRDVGFNTPKDKEKYQRLLEEAKPFQDKLNETVDKKNAAIVDFYNAIAEKIGGKKMHPEHLDYSNYYPAIKSPDGSAELLSSREVASLLRGTDQFALTADGKELHIRPHDFDGKDMPTIISNYDSIIQYNRGKVDDIRGGFQANMTPAPLVTSTDKFTKAGIKRLLRSAVYEGNDYLSFSSGDVQFDRWHNEGLIDYYDKIIPKVAKEIAKKLDPDAEVGFMKVRMDEDDFTNTEQRFTIEITPKMKEAIMGGQPLFSTPTIPLSGIFAEDNDNQQQGLLGK